MAIPPAFCSTPSALADSHRILTVVKSSPTHVTAPTTHHPSNNWSVARHQFPSILSSSTPLPVPQLLPNEEAPTAVNQVKQFLREDSFEGLRIIDAVQRLGIDHCFEHEIEALLRIQYQRYQQSEDKDLGDTLLEVALRFRLLRQGGHPVSADVFNKFMNDEGKWANESSEDVVALVELHEASQLSMEGEDILEEAQQFIYRKLKIIVQLDGLQAKTARKTLENPSHMSLKKFATNELLHSRIKSRWMSLLNELARTEMNTMKSMHQVEIHRISMWWEDMGLSKDLKFSRDQPLKWYLWSTACLPGPLFSEERVELTKSIAFIYLIDDIFDVFGTLDELALFTQSIQRWEFDDKLPQYMQACFKALDKVTNEISLRVYNKYLWNPKSSLQKTWGDLCGAFLVEAKWFASGYTPMVDEYLRNGMTSSGVHVALAHCFFLVGKGLTKETVKHIDECPDIVSVASKILRLWDDMGNAKDEKQDAFDGSYVECYMREYSGSTVNEAREKVTKLILTSFKQLNKEFIFPLFPLPQSFKKASLNLARMVSLMYSYDDEGALPLLEEYAQSLLTLL